MRISDWSSDVCSSDLIGGLVALPAVGREQRHRAARQRAQPGQRAGMRGLAVEVPAHIQLPGRALHVVHHQRETTLRFRSPIGVGRPGNAGELPRSEEHTSELQSLMRISYAVFGLKKKKT